jgi:branched-chain amino acid transport system permease protein
VNPDTFPVALSILFLASLVLGGLASLYGALIGAFLMEFLQFYAQDPPFTSADFTRAPSVVFGVVLILVMFIAPSGIVGLLRRLTRPVVARFARPRQAAGEHSTVVQSRRAES